MAAPTIEVVIAAQAEQFKRELDAVRNRLRALENNLGQGTRRGTGKFIKSTNQAQNALRDFSRVVQDAPFGIIGVGNNIQELSGTFGSLIRTSGGVIGALRSMIGAMAGPGGLVLVVAAVTTALTVFELRANRTKKAVDEVADAIKKIQEQNNLQLAVLDTQIKSAELVNERTDELLRKKIEVYLVELDSLNNLLEQQKAAIKLIEYESKRKTLLEDALKIQQEALVVAGALTQEAIKQAFATFLSLAEDINLFGGEDAVEKFLTGIENIWSRIDEKAELTKNEEQQILDINKQQEEVMKAREAAYQKILDLAKQIRAQNQKIDVQAKGIATGTVPAFKVGVVATGDTSIEAPEVMTTKVQKDLTDLEQRFFLFRANIINIFKEGVGPVVAGFGEDIGTALSRGASLAEAGAFALVNALSSLVSAIADEMIKIGTEAIVIGTVQEALEKFTSGAAKIVSGLAAVAIGLSLKGVSSAAKGSVAPIGGARGAGGISSTGGGSSSAGPSFAPLGEQVVVFEIAGTKLVGVLDRTLGRNNRLTNSRI